MSARPGTWTRLVRAVERSGGTTLVIDPPGHGPFDAIVVVDGSVAFLRVIPGARVHHRGALRLPLHPDDLPDLHRWARAGGFIAFLLLAKTRWYLCTADLPADVTLEQLRTSYLLDTADYTRAGAGRFALYTSTEAS